MDILFWPEFRPEKMRDPYRSSGYYRFQAMCSKESFWWRKAAMERASNLFPHPDLYGQYFFQYGGRFAPIFTGGKGNGFPVAVNQDF